MLTGVEIGDGKVQVGASRESNVAHFTNRIAGLDVITLVNIASDPVQVVSGIALISAVVLNDDASIGVGRGAVIVGQRDPT
jgi:hypothetical protein